MPDSRTDDDDVFTLVMIGVGSFGAIAAGAWVLITDAWTQVVSWLLTHDVLVTSSTDPLLAVPKADGAGLDLPVWRSRPPSHCCC